MKLIFKTFVSGEIEMGMFVSVHSTQCEYTYILLFCVLRKVHSICMYTVHCAVYCITKSPKFRFNTDINTYLLTFK